MIEHDVTSFRKRLAPVVHAYRQVKAPAYLLTRATANLPSQKPRHGLAWLAGAATVMGIWVLVSFVPTPTQQAIDAKYPSLSMIDLSVISKSKVRVPATKVRVPLKPPRLPSKPKTPEVSQDQTVINDSNQFANTKEYYYAKHIG